MLMRVAGALGFRSMAWSHIWCYGAAPTQGQRLDDNNQEGLGSNERGRERGRHTGLTKG